jgi:hypothetical protein
MTSSRKKAVVRKFSRDWVAGYLSAENFLSGDMLELLALDGKVTAIGIGQIKWVCLVRDFNSGEVANPERLLRKTFAGRPRAEGLFVRIRLMDGDLIEGIAANDKSLLDAQGVFLTPPDMRSNTQRLWIPTSAIEELEVVAVIGGSVKKKTSAPPMDDSQERLF